MHIYTYIHTHISVYMCIRYVYVLICTYMHAYHDVLMEVREQIMRVSFLLPHGFLESNSDPPAWQQAPFSPERLYGSSYWLILCVNLSQASVIRDEGASGEEMLP